MDEQDSRVEGCEEDELVAGGEESSRECVRR